MILKVGSTNSKRTIQAMHGFFFILSTLLMSETHESYLLLDDTRASISLADCQVCIAYC